MFRGSPASLVVRLLEAGTSFFVKASPVPVCPELVYVEPGDVCTGGAGSGGSERWAQAARFWSLNQGLNLPGGF